MAETLYIITHAQFRANPSAYVGKDVVIKDFQTYVNPHAADDIYHINGVDVAAYMVPAGDNKYPIRFHWDGSTARNARIYFNADKGLYPPFYYDDRYAEWDEYLNTLSVVYEPFAENVSQFYGWAPSYEGNLGVIVRMTDGAGNSLPYDFYNIKFLRYPFKSGAAAGIPIDAVEDPDSAEYVAYWQDYVTRCAAVENGFGVNGYVGEQELYAAEGAHGWSNYTLAADGTRVFAVLGALSISEGSLRDFIIVEVDGESPVYLFTFNNRAWMLNGTYLTPFHSYDAYLSNVIFSNPREDENGVYVIPNTLFFYNQYDAAIVMENIELNSAYYNVFNGVIKNITALDVMNFSILSGTIDSVTFRSEAIIAGIFANVTNIVFMYAVNGGTLKDDVSNKTVNDNVMFEIIEFPPEPVINYWRIPFASRYGHNYEVRIYNAPGETPITITGTDKPVTIKEQDSNFMLTPIRTQSGKLSMICELTGVDFADIMPTTPTNRPVAIFQNNLLVWQGFLKYEVFSENFMEYRDNQSVTLICPLYIGKVVGCTSMYMPSDLVPMAAILASIMLTISGSLPYNIGYVNIDYAEQFIGGTEHVTTTQAWLRAKIQNLWFFDRNGQVLRTSYEALEAFCEVFGLTARMHNNELYLLAVDDNVRGRDIKRISLEDLIQIASSEIYQPAATTVNLSEISLFSGPLASTSQTRTTVAALAEITVSSKKDDRESSFSFSGKWLWREYYYNQASSAQMTVEDATYIRYTKEYDNNFRKSNGDLTVGPLSSDHHLGFRYSSLWKRDSSGAQQVDDYDVEFKIPYTGNDYMIVAYTEEPVYIHNAKFVVEFDSKKYSNSLPSDVYSDDETKPSFRLMIGGTAVSIGQDITGYYYGKAYILMSNNDTNNHFWISNLSLSIEPMITTYDIESEFSQKIITNGFLSKKSITLPWIQDNSTPCIANRLIDAEHYGTASESSDAYVHAQNTLNRIVRFHGVTRHAYKLDLLNNGNLADISPVVVATDGPDGNKFYPIAVEKNYADDAEKVTLINIDD